MAWKNLEPLPVARWYHGVAVWRNFLYVLGGASDASLAVPVLSVLKSRINAFDGGNQPWVSCAPAMTVGKLGVKVLALGGPRAPGNGVLMVVGGHGSTNDDAGVLPAQDILSAKLDSDGNVTRWTTQTGALPVPLQDVGTCIHNSWLYVFGGKSLAPALAYKAQTVNFAVNEVVRGETSGAVGTVVTDTDAGATGTLVLKLVTGLFQDNEALYVREAQAVAAQVTRLDYNTGTGAFTVGQVVTGGTSGAVGTISVKTGTVATGTLTLTGVVGTFQAAETITDPITGSAKAVAAQYTALDYTGQVQNFVVGQTVKGLTSGATAVIGADADAGTTGTLTITGGAGTFQAAEWLIVEKAVADGANLLFGADSTAIYRARLEEDGSVGPFTTLSAILPTTVFYGKNSVLVRDRLIITEDGLMYTARIMPGGDIGPWVTTALPFKASYHVLLRMGDDDIVSISGQDTGTTKPQVWSTSVEADGTPKRWAQQMPLLTEVDSGAAVQMGDRMFVVGGTDDGGTILTKVQTARLNSSGQI